MKKIIAVILMTVCQTIVAQKTNNYKGNQWNMLNFTLSSVIDPTFKNLYLRIQGIHQGWIGISYNGGMKNADISVIELKDQIPIIGDYWGNENREIIKDTDLNGTNNAFLIQSKYNPQTHEWDVILRRPLIAVDLQFDQPINLRDYVPQNFSLSLGKSPSFNEGTRGHSKAETKSINYSIRSGKGSFFEDHLVVEIMNDELQQLNDYKIQNNQRLDVRLEKRRQQLNQTILNIKKNPSEYNLLDLKSPTPSVFQNLTPQLQKTFTNSISFHNGQQHNSQDQKQQGQDDYGFQKNKMNNTKLQNQPQGQSLFGAKKNANQVIVSQGYNNNNKSNNQGNRKFQLVSTNMNLKNNYTLTNNQATITTVPIPSDDFLLIQCSKHEICQRFISKLRLT